MSQPAPRRRATRLCPPEWSDHDGTGRWERVTGGGYRLLVQAVCTDVDEWSTEAEVSCNGTSHARVWIGDTSSGAYAAAMWWCEGVAEVADWHVEQVPARALTVAYGATRIPETEMGADLDLVGPIKRGILGMLEASLWAAEFTATAGDDEQGPPV